MAGIQYDMVQENDPYYNLVTGDFLLILTLLKSLNIK